jgi:hypothetical protein
VTTTPSPTASTHPVTVVAMAVSSPRRGRIHFEVTTNPVITDDYVGFFHQVSNGSWKLIGYTFTDAGGKAHPSFNAPPRARWRVAAIVAAEGPGTTYATSPAITIRIHG